MYSLPLRMATCCRTLNTCSESGDGWAVSSLPSQRSDLNVKMNSPFVLALAELKCFVVFLFIFFLFIYLSV
jgi:hypothetical protein